MVVEGETGSHEAANGSRTAASANRLPVDVNVHSSIRRSMDEYYHQVTTSIHPPEPPPSYDDFLHSPGLRRRFNIQPREDEGREILPPYSSAISLENVFMKKLELEGAVHKAHDRNWYKVLVTLQGTALTFHKCKSSRMFGSAISGRKHSPDHPAGMTRGAFLRSYNLQHADVGIAADYLKKQYVIRVRAETEQFLLSCHKIETFVLWLQSLFAAIDLAPPLDDREIPQDLSIPRRIRRTNRAASSNIERNDQLIREQEEIMRTQFPNLVESMQRGIAEEGEGEDGEERGEGGSIAGDEDVGEGSSSRSTSGLSTPTPTPTRSATPFSSPSRTSILASSSSSPPSTLFPPSTSTPHTTSLLLRTRHTFSLSSHSTSSPRSSPSPTNPSISPEGKWRPQHQWTHFYDMMYARRCMAILTHRSPRKSNLVIMKGKQWIVDWATGKLTRVSPPEYGEVEEGKELSMAHYGAVVRA